MPCRRALIALLSAAWLLLSCAGPAAQLKESGPTAASLPTAASATGGTLRIGISAAPDSLNPGAAYLIEAIDIQSLVYDALLGLDARSRAIPQLAKAWSVGADGTTWTFTLHAGARWHDGQPLTAEDVVFTYTMIRSFTAFALLKSYTNGIASISAPDPLTVIISFEQPVANTDERFSTVPILPRHIWGQFADEQAATSFENLAMIGSGPFKMAEYRVGEFVRLSAVKDHYLSPPQIDEVIFRVFGSGDALAQALRAGEIDLSDVKSNTIVRSLQADPKLKIEIGESLGLTELIFNVLDPSSCPPEVGICSGHPALRDVRVRQALSHATDKQQMIDVLLLGLGSPGLSLVTPGQGQGFAVSLQDYTYDLERARQIFAEAGYHDSDGDGVREMPGDPDLPLVLRYSYPSDQSSNGLRIFELVRDMWRAAGVELTLLPLEASALTAICCPAFDFDVIQWGWVAGVDPSSLLNIATTAEITTGVSETGYSNPEYDALFAEQGVTIDQARRAELLKQMQALLLRDQPYLVLYYDQKVESYRTDRFSGWVIDPEGQLNLKSRLSLAVIRPVQ
jgi:peptide/nickel transport system substrate-binding protein